MPETEAYVHVFVSIGAGANDVLATSEAPSFIQAYEEVKPIIGNTPTIAFPLARTAIHERCAEGLAGLTYQLAVELAPHPLKS